MEKIAENSNTTKYAMLIWEVRKFRKIIWCLVHNHLMENVWVLFKSKNPFWSLVRPLTYEYLNSRHPSFLIKPYIKKKCPTHKGQEGQSLLYVVVFFFWEMNGTLWHFSGRLPPMWSVKWAENRFLPASYDYLPAALARTWYIRHTFMLCRSNQL